MNEVTCTVSGERAEVFRAVFGSATVPIMSPFVERGNLPGLGERDVYKLNLKKLTPEQRVRLVAYVAGRFDLPLAEVERDLEATGMPILAEGCVVSVPAALAMSMIDDFYEQRSADYDEWDEWDEWDDDDEEDS